MLNIYKIKYRVFGNTKIQYYPSFNDCLDIIEMYGSENHSKFIVSKSFLMFGKEKHCITLTNMNNLIVNIEDGLDVPYSSFESLRNKLLEMRN